MYSNIMIPVDLSHKDALEKAVTIGADLAKHYNAELHIIGVTDVTPGPAAHNPKEFEERLTAYAAELSAKHGCKFQPLAMISHDPAIEIDEKLQSGAEQVGADLVVMASHIPGFAEHIFASRAGYLASHSNLSVLVVR